MHLCLANYHFYLLSPELLRSCWNASGVNLDLEQGTRSLCGKIFFMSETEHACSRLCHPVFSRQKIPKNPHPKSFCFADSATGHSKCLSTSTAMCRTSSTATRCPVWLPRYLFSIRCLKFCLWLVKDSGFYIFLFVISDLITLTRWRAKGMESRQSSSTWLMLQRRWIGLQHVSFEWCLHFLLNELHLCTV